MSIRFRRITFVDNKRRYVNNVIDSDFLCDDEDFEASYADWFTANLGESNMLTTQCCAHAHALDMMSLLIGINEGDKVIMPSYII